MLLQNITRYLDKRSKIKRMGIRFGTWKMGRFEVDNPVRLLLQLPF
jgi:hypothetical protein